MVKFTGAVTVFVFCFILVVPRSSLFAVGDGGEIEQEKPSAMDIVRDAYSFLARSSISSWDNVRSLINEFQIRFVPPNLDFRSLGAESTAASTARERMKEAAEKSFGTSKQAVEESANSAAKAVGEIVHKATEKVAGSKPAEDSSNAEL